MGVECVHKHWRVQIKFKSSFVSEVMEYSKQSYPKHWDEESASESDSDSGLHGPTKDQRKWDHHYQVQSEYEKQLKTRKVELMQRPTQSRTQARLYKHLSDAVDAQEGFYTMHSQMNEIAGRIMNAGTNNMEADELNRLKSKVNEWMVWLRKKHHYARGDDIDRVQKLKATLEALNPRKPELDKFKMGRNVDIEYDSFKLPDTAHMVFVHKGGAYTLQDMDPLKILDEAHTLKVGQRAIGFILVQQVGKHNRHAVCAVIDPVKRVIEYFDPNGWKGLYLTEATAETDSEATESEVDSQATESEEDDDDDDDHPKWLHRLYIPTPASDHYHPEGVRMWQDIRDEWIPLFNGNSTDTETQEAFVALMHVMQWPVGGWKIVDPQLTNWSPQPQSGGFCINYAFVYLRLRSEGKTMAEAADRLRNPALACGSVAKVAMGKDPKTWAARTRGRTHRRTRGIKRARARARASTTKKKTARKSSKSKRRRC